VLWGCRAIYSERYRQQQIVDKQQQQVDDTVWHKRYNRFKTLVREVLKAKS
jgi:hypothetical protein